MISIQSILTRLQTSLGPNVLASQLLLLSGMNSPPSGSAPKADALTLVVGYDGSPKSQAALDLAFYIAHQTRLVTPQSVTIHAVHVLSQLTQNPAILSRVDALLWQARCLAEEWRGCFSTHLRLGSVATELAAFTVDHAADLLLLGCHTSHHPRIQQLAPVIRCPVLGIPATLPSEERSPRSNSSRCSVKMLAK